MRSGAIALFVACAALGCGGISEDVDATVATVTPVRGSTSIGDTTAAVVARVASGASVHTSERGLSRLALDLGPQALLDRGTHVEVTDASSFTLEAGRAFVETQAGEQIQVSTAQGSLRASDASFSARAGEGETVVYVVRGEVSWTHGQERGVAGAGEQLELGGGGAERSAATLWHDWTGGLARPGPSTAEGPAGVGMLEARVPDEVGQARWPLVVRRLDVRVRVEGDLAVTEVDQLFFNPASETVEGLYRIRVPEDAVLQRFAVDRDERLVDGYVRERAQARQAYERQVYQGSTEDPALLEWDAPGRYKARIYPIAPGATRRIVIRYAQWLHAPAGGAHRLYRYPMGGGARAPHIQEFALSADVADAGAESVRAGMGALVGEGAVRIRRSDFRPRADFWLELVGGQQETQRAWRAPHEPPPRAPDAPEMPGEADEHDYFYLPLVLPTDLTDQPIDAVDLVVIADVSAGTDRSHLELGRSVVESLAAHLGDDDRIAIVSADLTIRSVIEGEEATLGEATSARIERLLDGLARIPGGGATDLGEAVVSAAGLLDPARHGAVVYVGDGAPTVGELQADGLLERFARLPEPVRLYSIAVGSDANLELLQAVTRGAGLTLRVEERAEAADAALRVLGHATRPVAHGVSVSLGDGIENPFPRRPMDAVLGDVFHVSGRVADEVPQSVTVTGTIDGEEFSREIPVEVHDTEESTDLRLRWASERLRQLLLGGAGREDVAELGTRYGLITPFTSYYVPSRRELSQMGPQARRWIDQPLLPVGDQGPGAPEMVAGAVFTLALGPLAIASCAGEDAPAMPMEEETPDWALEPEADDSEGGHGRRSRGDEGAMGEEATERTQNRYGIEGPSDNQDPQMAREAARDEAANAGVLGTLRDQTGAWNSPTSPHGADQALGNDPQTALGQLMGDHLGRADADEADATSGSNSGFGGLGLRGTGRGGGGTGEGTIGLGNLGTIGHGGGGGSGSGYGRGAGGMRGRTAAVPRIRTGNADVRGSLSREVVRRVIRRHINEVRFCYEQELDTRPDLEGRVLVGFVIGPNGSVLTSTTQSTTLNDARVEACINAAVRRWTFPQPEGGGAVGVSYPFVLSTVGGEGGGGRAAPAQAPDPASALVAAALGDGEAPRVVTTIVHTTDPSAHQHRRCSDAAFLPLDDRQALWRERLGAENTASGWVRLYREAARDCEADTWRERRAFLSLILGRAGSIEGMTQVYRLLDAAAARRYVRARILRRVRTPQDLRTVRAAFGLGQEVDWELVDQVLDRARTDTAKLRAMRRLAMQYSHSFELKLRLLSMLERNGLRPEAVRLADRMRADPLADPGVRTAIGEMFLRMGEETEARRVFSEIVEFAPLDELARRRLGDLYRAHGWFEDAYRQYETLREIRPDDPSVLLLLAQAAAGAGRVNEALGLERRVTQTSEPGSSQGIARTALLLSSVRYARLFSQARQGDDAERLEELERRRRRSGVLREAGALRVTLVWAHPDAQLGLWIGLPGLSPSRPADISPEFGVEAFHLEEQEAAPYRIEVRRSADEHDLNLLQPQLVVVWNEGEDDERVEIIDLTFDQDRDHYAWTLTGRTLTPDEE